jgi:hypothetical protein
MFALFPPGQIVATRWALAALESTKPPTGFFARHAIGDWRELEPTDIAENEYSVAHGFRLLSSYKTEAREKIWIITEADRSATTLLSCAPGTMPKNGNFRIWTLFPRIQLLTCET